MDGSGGPIREQAFDVLPAGAGIVDSEGVLVQINNAWADLGEQTGSSLFTASSGVDYLEIYEQCEHEGATVVSEGIQAVLQAHEQSVSHIRPFEGTIADEWFLLRIVGFNYQNEHYALIVFTEMSDIEEDQLTPREQIQRLESAMSIISHDLRTPISVIRGYAEILEDEIDGESEALSRIQSASARADTIIDDALTLARGASFHERDLVELDEVVQEVWDGLEDITDEATLEIEDSFAFEANRGLLHRLFENLFMNSIQHAGSAVTVRVGKIEIPDSATVGFYVEDDGQGLPEDAVGEIFSPGFTTDRDQGYGLGLTIVQAVVEAHGWAITATNGEDGGARFEVSGIQPRTD